MLLARCVYVLGCGAVIGKVDAAISGSSLRNSKALRSAAVYGPQWQVIESLRKAGHGDEAFRRRDAWLQAYEAF